MIHRFRKYVHWQFFLIPRFLKFVLWLFEAIPGKFACDLGMESTRSLSQL